MYTYIYKHTCTHINTPHFPSWERGNMKAFRALLSYIYLQRIINHVHFTMNIQLTIYVWYIFIIMNYFLQYYLKISY